MMAASISVPAELADRIRKTSREASAATEEAAAALEDRDFLLKVAHEMGATVRTLAEITGLSPQRVHQITLEQSEPLAVRLREAMSHLMVSVDSRSENLVLRSAGIGRRAVLSRGQARLLLPRARSLRTPEDLFGWIGGRGWQVRRYSSRNRKDHSRAGM